jgi:hypothetical protein
MVGPAKDGPPAVGVRTIARRFWPYARPYRWSALAVLIAGLLSPAIEAGTIWLFKIVIDRVLIPRDFRLFGLIAAGYLALTVAGGLLSFATGYVSTSVSGRFVLSLRTALFRHVQGLSLDFLERARLGDLLSCITSDVAAIESFLLSGAVQAAVQAVRVVVFGGASSTWAGGSRWWRFSWRRSSGWPRASSRAASASCRASAAGAAASSARWRRRRSPTSRWCRRTAARTQRRSGSTAKARAP